MGNKNYPWDMLKFCFATEHIMRPDFTGDEGIHTVFSPVLQKLPTLPVAVPAQLAMQWHLYDLIFPIFSLA